MLCMLVDSPYMYVYTHIHIDIYTYTYTHIYIYIYIYIHPSRHMRHDTLGKKLAQARQCVHVYIRHYAYPGEREGRACIIGFRLDI